MPNELYKEFPVQSFHEDTLNKERALRGPSMKVRRLDGEPQAALHL